MSLQIVKPGVYSTVQDLGRPGLASSGVPAGGAADRRSLILANRLVGNPDGAAAIEMTLVGATVTFETSATIALAGAAPAGTPTLRPIDVPAGTTLALGPLSGGARGYLAVAGGIEAPMVLGSRSTHVASGLGGHQGRPLRALDTLPIGLRSFNELTSIDYVALRTLVDGLARTRLRIVPGAQAATLGREAIDGLLSTEFTVSDRSDRVGLRLVAKPGPLRAARHEMITEAVLPGAIQLPPDGEPIILGPDAPVTGGYPALASVIAADLPALGQLAPRQRVSFELVSLTEALDAYRRVEALVDAATNNRE